MGSIVRSVQGRARGDTVPSLARKRKETSYTMTEIVKRITLDLSRRSDARVVYATQEDMHTRKFVFTLTDCGRPYPVPKGLTAMVNVSRPDGEAQAFMGEINSDGTVSYLVDSWVLGVVGETKCSVSLYDGLRCRLTSASFIIDVHDGIYVGQDASSSENYSTWLEMVAQLNGIQEAEAARVEAEEERADAEFLRMSSEARRVYEENLRASAEASRHSAELDRVAADDIRLSRFSNAIAEVMEATERANAISDASLSFDVRVRRAEKRIANLEEGREPSPFEEDTTTAYEKAVPTATCPYAEIVSVGGMSKYNSRTERIEKSAVSAIESFDQNGDIIDTVTFSDEITDLDGYGEGINSSLCNTVIWDLDNGLKKYVKKVRRYTFDGNEAWTYVSSTYEESVSGNIGGYMCLGIDATDGPAILSHGAYGKGVSDGKITVSGYWAYSMCGSSNDVYGFMQMLKGYYAEGKPLEAVVPILSEEEIDLSETLSDDNLIKVEGGGKLRFANESGKAVPSKIVYQVKEVVE